MEISNFELKTDFSECVIIHPETGKKTDIVIHVISSEHPDFKSKNLELARKSIKKKDDISEFVEKKNQIVAASIVGWKNITIAGKELKYSQANAIKLLGEYPWIRDQVDTFATERENFFKGSGKA